MSLTTFIKNDLTSKILSGDNLPTNMSLIVLSRQYGVSITPVREAIGALIEEGIIDKLPNRRLRINPEIIGTGAPRETVAFPPEPADWGEKLLDEVMLESLSKQAVYLRENLLAEKYNVGRSIIRHTFTHAFRSNASRISRC